MMKKPSPKNKNFYDWIFFIVLLLFMGLVFLRASRVYQQMELKSSRGRNI